MRCFVIIGQKADPSGNFLIDDLPGTSGRLDILLRCVRAALLVSHGVRADVVVYLVLAPEPEASAANPAGRRVLRIRGDAARFVRPDERSLAFLAKKSLATQVDAKGAGFADVRAGIALSRGGLEGVAADLGAMPFYVLDESGTDLRHVVSIGRSDRDAAFFIGDHLGFDGPTRDWLKTRGARSVSVGPVGLHAEDVVTIVSNEIDRRMAGAGWLAT